MGTMQVHLRDGALGRGGRRGEGDGTQISHESSWGRSPSAGPPTTRTLGVFSTTLSMPLPSSLTTAVAGEAIAACGACRVPGAGC